MPKYNTLIANTQAWYSRITGNCSSCGCLGNSISVSDLAVGSRHATPVCCDMQIACSLLCIHLMYTRVVENNNRQLKL